MPEAEQLDMLQDVVVKIDADPQIADVVVKADDPVKDLAAQYKELEAKSAEQEKAREAAEQREAAAQREASQARQEAASARTAATASNLDTITTAIAASQSAIDAAKRDLRTAVEAQDIDAQVDAQDRLTTARVDLRTYDEAKSTLEARTKATPQRPADPVEAYIQGRTEPTAQWLRQHREFVTDPRKNQKLTAAHHDAVAEGLSPDTADYFTHVEKFIGVRKETKEVTEGDNVQRPGAQPKRPSAIRNVAPVNGARGSGGAVDNNEVRLSQGEAKSATDGTLVWNYDDPSGQKKFRKGEPIGIQEMARRKRSMGASGLYDRSFEVQ